MRQLTWYVKQLVPLRYKTTYTYHMGVRLDCITRATWWMWFGKVFWLKPSR